MRMKNVLDVNIPMIDDYFDLYDLRDEFVDNNVECSLNNYKASPQGIIDAEGHVFVSIDSNQLNDRDDIVGL